MFDKNKNGEAGPRIGRSVVVRGNEAVKRLKIGLDAAVDAIGATLGPRGRCVIIAGENDGQPVVTKDGVTVSRSIDPVDPVERMGARLVREAASRTNDEAGDGTTTASVLTGALVSSVVKYSSAGFEPSEVKRGLDDATALVLLGLSQIAERIDTEEALRDIATISANGDTTIGALVAQAVHKTGVDGVVTVENARSSTTTLEIVEGLRFDRGYLSPYFVTDQEKMHATYEDCAVLVTDRKLTNLKDIIPLLEDCNRNRKPLLIVAEDVDGDAMHGLVLNKATNGLPVVAVKLPGLGPDRDAQMHDLIALVGGNNHPTLSSGKKVEDITSTDLIGKVKKIIVDARSTTIVGRPDAQERIMARSNELRAQFDDVSLSEEEVDAIKRRLAKLTSGAAVVRVGGTTEIELIERKYRVEDALHAARAALEEGIVPGGGYALIKIRQKLLNSDGIAKDIAKGDAYAAGVKAVLDACMAPLRRIAKNAGQSPDVVVERCNNHVLNNHGWDAVKADIVDLRQTGILDPVKVTRCAFQNAVSVAGIFLLLDSVIHEPV